jgi:general stress protein YciG
MKELTVKEFASKGGKARAKKYSKEKISEWGKKGGRPIGKKLDKSVIPKPNI